MGRGPSNHRRQKRGGIPVFYFDLGSPFAYLAAERINTVLKTPPIWQPILLGALFKRFERSSWSGDPETRPAGMAEVERRAHERGLLPIRWPDPWPTNTLMAMRAATYAAQIGRGIAFAIAAFRQAYAAGRDLADPDAIAIAGAACEIHPRALLKACDSQAIKDALQAATEAAGDLGVRGVPTVAIGEQLFWGDDRLEETAAALRDL